MNNRLKKQPGEELARQDISSVPEGHRPKKMTDYFSMARRQNFAEVLQHAPQINAEIAEDRLERN